MVWLTDGVLVFEDLSAQRDKLYQALATPSVLVFKISSLLIRLIFRSKLAEVGTLH